MICYTRLCNGPGDGDGDGDDADDSDGDDDENGGDSACHRCVFLLYFNERFRTVWGSGTTLPATLPATLLA